MDPYTLYKYGDYRVHVLYVVSDTTQMAPYSFIKRHFFTQTECDIILKNNVAHYVALCKPYIVYAPPQYTRTEEKNLIQYSIPKYCIH